MFCVDTGELAVDINALAQNVTAKLDYPGKDN